MSCRVAGGENRFGHDSSSHFFLSSLRELRLTQLKLLGRENQRLDLRLDLPQARASPVWLRRGSATVIGLPRFVPAGLPTRAGYRPSKSSWDARCAPARVPAPKAASCPGRKLAARHHPPHLLDELAVDRNAAIGFEGEHRCLYVLVH